MTITGATLGPDRGPGDPETDANRIAAAGKTSIPGFPLFSLSRQDEAGCRTQKEIWILTREIQPIHRPIHRQNPGGRASQFKN